ncbi:hypothetical protein [Neokomagataea anthophila]|uniref:ABM domain-containing protein n=1 Tax=Neokomagataea anthophila TaxID=2826925 RepID=A0ABS5E9I2_9PROT|nr:hypothetical protein [Neokomagataea anthophila]MBR0560446.1 hypothetical protein [Neokomagataea anthophila]
MAIIELSTFSLKPEIEESTFLEALAQSDAWLARQPGFIRRSYGCGELGWVDYVEYESLESAKSINQRFLSASEAQAFMGAIDFPTVEMRHFDLKL